jgi:hypothetical protein
MLSVLAKRTYRLFDSGRCVLAEEQLPLQEEILTDPADPELVIADPDLYPYKFATDVVVRGHVRCGASCRQLEVTVEVGPAEKTLLVLGERRAAFSAAGRLFFSEPKFLEEIPLSYCHAYGGRDAIAEARYGIPAEPYKEYLPKHMGVKDLSPYRYPRNPCGKGYVIDATPEAIGALELPRIEDPLDRLTPDRIPLGQPGAWPRMPLPASFDWVNLGWFPRVAYLGVLPDFNPLEGPVAEVTRGFAPPDVLKDAPLQDKFSMRMANGASLGLQFPYLRGDENCRLQNIHRKHRSFSFQLPGDRPQIWTDGRKGKLNETQPVLHTVVIEPDEERVTLLWRGSAPALRPYLPDELKKMPLKVVWP